VQLRERVQRKETDLGAIVTGMPCLSEEECDAATEARERGGTEAAPEAADGGAGPPAGGAGGPEASEPNGADAASAEAQAVGTEPGGEAGVPLRDVRA